MDTDPPAIARHERAGEPRLSRFLYCKIRILSVYNWPLVPRMAGGSAKICVLFNLRWGKYARYALVKGLSFDLTIVEGG
ncbi:MAG: hypothetical protein SRB2_03604 [Desulfobacteraceae bacterium Eth-SRB2]|nr:MAG: hypothetical protein SRB2_03604 [Desulfobacteraceae bacterium Eth-SRB2]